MIGGLNVRTSRGRYWVYLRYVCIPPSLLLAKTIAVSMAHKILLSSDLTGQSSELKPSNSIKPSARSRTLSQQIFQPHTPSQSNLMALSSPYKYI